MDWSQNENVCEVVGILAGLDEFQQSLSNPLYRQPLPTSVAETFDTKANCLHAGVWMHVACITCLCRASHTDSGHLKVPTYCASDARLFFATKSARARPIVCNRHQRHTSCRSCRCLHPRPSRRCGSHPWQGLKGTPSGFSLQVWLLLLRSEEDTSGLADVISTMSSERDSAELRVGTTHCFVHQPPRSRHQPHLPSWQ